MNPTTEAGKRLLDDLAGDTEGTTVLVAYRSGLAHDIAAIETEAVAAERTRIAEAARRKQDLICSCHLPECPRLAAVLDALGLGQAEFDRLMMAVTRLAEAKEMP